MKAVLPPYVVTASFARPQRPQHSAGATGVCCEAMVQMVPQIPPTFSALVVGKYLVLGEAMLTWCLYLSRAARQKRH